MRSLERPAECSGHSQITGADDRNRQGGIREPMHPPRPFRQQVDCGLHAEHLQGSRDPIRRRVGQHGSRHLAGPPIAFKL